MERSKTSDMDFAVTAVGSVPTLAEQGVTGCESGTWQGVLVANGTPPALYRPPGRGFAHPAHNGGHDPGKPALWIDHGAFPHVAERRGSRRMA